MIINFSHGAVDRMMYEVATFTASVDPETVPLEYINRNYENLMKYGNVALKENYKPAEIHKVSMRFFQKFGFRFMPY